MRLIDADKICVIPATDDNITGMGMTREEQDAYNKGIEAVMAKIKNAETIDKPSIAICDSAENFDPVYCEERERDVVYNTGRKDALLEVLEIIDKVSHKASSRGQFWTAEKAIKVLRRDILAMKGI